MFQNIRTKLIRQVRSHTGDNEPVRHQKIQLIQEIDRSESVRDYGGLWGVHGWYLAQAVQILRCKKAWMIDSLEPSESWLSQQEGMNKTLDCQVETTRADFRDHRAFVGMEPAEVSLLYDILLHQDVACEVIKNVCSKTTRKICVSQPVLNEKLFGFPNVCVNLQFAPPSLKRRLRKGLSCWPPEPEFDHFEAAFWIWGQTRSFLSSVFYGYGFDEECGRLIKLSKYFDYVFLRYRRR